MMYKYIDHIAVNLKNNHKFLVAQDSLFFLDENDGHNELIIKPMTKQSSIIKFQLTGESQIHELYEQFLLVKEDYKDTIIFDVKNNKRVHIDSLDGYEIGHKNHENYLWTYKKLSDRAMQGVFDFTSKKMLWQKGDIKLSGIYEGIVLGPMYRAEVLTRFDLATGESLWDFDFRDLGKFNKSGSDHSGHTIKVLGVLDNRVFVALTNNYLVALDVETGELQNKWRELPNGATWSQKKYNFIPKPEFSTLLKDEKKIIGMTHQYYWEVDLQTNELSFNDLTAHFNDNHVLLTLAGGASYKDSHAFFCSVYYSENVERNLVKDHKIGGFNIKTKKVVWLHTFDFPEGVTFKSPPPVIGGNHLYVLDTTGTLHIFERV